MAASNGSIRTSALLALGALLVTAMLIVPALLHAQATPAPAMAAPAAPKADMQAISKAFGALRGQIADATKNEASLALLADLQKASISAKGDMPPTVLAMADADRPARLVEYKKEMIKLIRQELDTEEALLSGDNAKAGDLVKAMGATQQEGHRGFRGGRGGGGGGAAPARGQ